MLDHLDAFQSCQFLEKFWKHFFQSFLFFLSKTACTDFKRNNESVELAKCVCLRGNWQFHLQPAGHQHANANSLSHSLKLVINCKMSWIASFFIYLLYLFSRNVFFGITGTPFS